MRGISGQGEAEQQEMKGKCHRFACRCNDDYLLEERCWRQHRWQWRRLHRDSYRRVVRLELAGGATSAAQQRLLPKHERRAAAGARQTLQRLYVAESAHRIRRGGSV